MKAVGFGVIGLGRQGLRLSEHIRKDIKSGKLIAVCRRSECAKDYAKKHGVIYYSNYHELLNNKEIDVVIITTPSNLHGIHAIEALRAEKHILIDKPLASNLNEGHKILSLAKKNKCIVAINFPLRVNQVTKTIKAHLKKIGKLMMIQIIVSHGPVRNKWQLDITLSNGGVIMDLGSHFFDLVSFLTGKRPEKIVSAFSEKTSNENSGFINLEYNGVNVSMVLLRNQKLKKSFITCAGSKGFLSADYVSRKVILSSDKANSEIKCPEGYDYEDILNNLVGAITNKENILADANDGFNSLMTALSVYKAIQTQKAVII
ncbi:MAG: gfo/Idh/MocA family oxidoreductase [Nitrospiraceae bacterium]|nr:MAG: gfo/Idh/MocA family oxidoreductase [Nitrospiraceae bacterium]